MKHLSRPPLPAEMSYYTKKDSFEQRCNWNYVSKDYVQFVKRILRKSGKETRMDMSDPMLKRRIQAVVEYADKIIERYRNVPGLEYEHRDDTGNIWVELNFTPATTYNLIEEHAYLLCAAAIWILDEILADDSKRTKLFRILPRDDREIDELWCAPDFWHVNYDYELVMSVIYVLYNRNTDIAPIEMDDENTERIIINSLIAKGEHRADVSSRKAFEELMALIPQKSIERAVGSFEELFWLWTDRYFECIAPISAAIRDAVDKVNGMADDFNAARKELKTAIDEMTNLHETQSKKNKPVFNPLLVNPFQDVNNPLKASASPISPFSKTSGQVAFSGSPMQKVLEITQRLERISDQHSDAVDRIENLEHKKAGFAMDILRMGYIRTKECQERYGAEVARKMKPLRVTNPFEVCFALMWLIEHDSDLPWLYGCGCGLMEEVIESLPWGVIEYKEMHDPVWNPEEETDEQLSFIEMPKQKKPAGQAVVPDWYERRYMPEEDELFAFNRSLAQILYEETGCIMPRDMHKYDGRQKALRKYGVSAKETSSLLLLFTALSNAKRAERALNFDEHLMQYWDEEEDIVDEGEKKEGENKALSYDELAEKLKQAQVENKKLRTSLHESEKTSRETRKELAYVKSSAEMDHRELADLRELIFNQENEEECEADVSVVDESVFPYDVQKETVIFGGHETWLKAIRPMLSGNIRFMDKDINFNVNVIRNAEIVWIQSNAMSHSQYYRIVDVARQYKKPVRYFTYASAAKSALQVLKADQ